MRRGVRRGALALALCAAGCAPPGHAASPPSRVARGGEVVQQSREVRVALATRVESARLAATGDWALLDEGGRLLARARDGAEWRATRSGRALRLAGATGAASAEGVVIARPMAAGAVITWGGRRWRGELWLVAGDDGITVVNHLPIEEYLRGVVPLELNLFGPSDHAALEAQAVAARSYTYSRLAEYLPQAAAQRQARLPFDLRNTTSDQVYGGVDAEQPATDRAIRATAGLVIRYAGAVVSAPYHSACGGATAAPPEVWRAEPEGYLRSVSDRIPGTERHYCDLAPRFRWTREWSGDDLEAVLERYLRRMAAPGAPAGPVGAVREVTALGRTESGRVRALAVRTDAGRYELRGNDIRFALRTLGGDILPSTYFSVESAPVDGGRLARLVLRGNGNGHGVGMCQWGAVGRARAGQDFRTILRTYYPGTTIEPAE